MDDSQRKLAAEFVGTFALIFFGCGAALQGADLVGAALANGLAIGLMVTAVGHISGGHFNPAVTLSMLVTGRISPGEGARYVVSQLAGATAAALVLLAIFPSAITDAANLGVPAVGGNGISTGNALVAEIVTTFFLVFVIYGVAVDKRGPAMIAPLAIGLTITMDIFAMGPITGAAMNPARFLGPAIISNHYDNEWVYWVGPGIGAVLAAFVYAYILIPPYQEPPPVEPDRLAQP